MAFVVQYSIVSSASSEPAPRVETRQYHALVPQDAVSIGEMVARILMDPDVVSVTVFQRND